MWRGLEWVKQGGKWSQFSKLGIELVCTTLIIRCPSPTMFWYYFSFSTLVLSIRDSGQRCRHDPSPLSAVAISFSNLRSVPPISFIFLLLVAGLRYCIHINIEICHPVKVMVVFGTKVCYKPKCTSKSFNSCLLTTGILRSL